MDDTAPETRSPRVLANRWSHLDVEGLGELKDAKLWPGGGREWDWTETGTQHHQSSSRMMCASSSSTAPT